MDSSTDSPAEPTTSPSFPASRPQEFYQPGPGPTSGRSCHHSCRQRSCLASPGVGSDLEPTLLASPRPPGSKRAPTSTTSSGPSQGPSGPTHRPQHHLQPGPRPRAVSQWHHHPHAAPQQYPQRAGCLRPKSSRRHQKRPTTKATSSTSVPELPASCQPESSPRVQLRVHHRGHL